MNMGRRNVDNLISIEFHLGGYPVHSGNLASEGREGQCYAKSKSGHDFLLSGIT